MSATDATSPRAQTLDSDIQLQILNALRGLQERQTNTSQTEGLLDALSAVVQEAVKEQTLTDEERQWVRLAIQKEAQSIKLRQAIIEKTLTGLVWMAVVALGVMIKEYAQAHGMWRPS